MLAWLHFFPNFHEKEELDRNKKKDVPSGGSSLGDESFHLTDQNINLLKIHYVNVTVAKCQLDYHTWWEYKLE